MPSAQGTKNNVTKSMHRIISNTEIKNNGSLVLDFRVIRRPSKNLGLHSYMQ